MKKLLLGLGTVAAIVAPVASVVACSNADQEANKYLESDLTLSKIELIGHYTHVKSKTDETRVDDKDYVQSIHYINGDQTTYILGIENMIKEIKQYQNGVISNAYVYYKGSDGTSHQAYQKPTGDAIIQVIYTNGKIVRKSLDSLVDYLMYVNDISNKDLKQ